MADNVAEVEQNKEVVVEDKKEDVNPIEEAKKVLEENKKLLKDITEERKRVEKATAEMLVNGRSYAGKTPPQISEEQKKKEGAAEFFKGSSIEKAIRKHG